MFKYIISENKISSIYCCSYEESGCLSMFSPPSKLAAFKANNMRSAPTQRNVGGHDGVGICEEKPSTRIPRKEDSLQVVRNSATAEEKKKKESNSKKKKSKKSFLNRVTGKGKSKKKTSSSKSGMSKKGIKKTKKSRSNNRSKTSKTLKKSSGKTSRSSKSKSKRPSNNKTSVSVISSESCPVTVFAVTETKTTKMEKVKEWSSRLACAMVGLLATVCVEVSFAIVILCYICLRENLSVTTNLLFVILHLTCIFGSVELVIQRSKKMCAISFCINFICAFIALVYIMVAESETHKKKLSESELMSAKECVRMAAVSTVIFVANTLLILVFYTDEFIRNKTKQTTQTDVVLCVPKTPTPQPPKSVQSVEEKKKESVISDSVKDKQSEKKNKALAYFDKLPFVNKNQADAEALKKKKKEKEDDFPVVPNVVITDYDLESNCEMGEVQKGGPLSYPAAQQMNYLFETASAKGNNKK